jgi:phosphohistidine phosphatase SixA
MKMPVPQPDRFVNLPVADRPACNRRSDPGKQPHLKPGTMKMNRRALLGLAALALVSACMRPASPAAGPEFYVMRHLHKADASADPGLSAEGQRQAQMLVARLAANPPKVIYVTATRRARETAAPIAARLRLEPRVYDPRETAGLVSELIKGESPALVVGHSNTVPEIVAALGGARPGPIADTDYGTIYRVSGPGRVVTRLEMTR